MAKVVNYAGTVLSLNTDKYSKSLKKMQSETASTLKSVTASFKSMLAPLAGFVGVTSSFRQVVSSLKDYESKVSSLSGITSSLDEAKALFSDLNALSRKLPQPFDEIAQSAVNLNKVGLKPSEQTMKSLSAIAVGTGKSLTEVSQILTNASLNRLKSLQQLGIEADRVGDKLILSYKGQKETIEATNVALEQYMQRLAKQNFSQTLDFQMQGMTGATKNLSDAWSDLWTTISTGQVGQEIAKTIYKASQALDAFTSTLNSPAVQQIMGGFVRLFTGAFETIANGLGNLVKPFAQFFGVINESGEKTAKAEIGYFEGWFDFVRLGLGDLIGWIDKWWQKTTAYAEHLGAIVASATNGSTQEILQQQSLQLKMQRKVKELGLENSAIMKRSGQVDMSAILQMPKEHPLVKYYMEQRTAVVQAHKNISESVKESEQSLQDRLKQIDEESRKNRNKYYDELAQTRIKTLDAINKKTEISYNSAVTAIGNIAGKGSKGLRQLSKDAGETERAYKSLLDTIAQAQYNKLSPFEKEDVDFTKQIDTLKQAHDLQLINDTEFHTVEEQLTALHLEKMSQLYDEYYQQEAEKRQQALDALKQREQDWNSGTGVNALDQFSEKLAKYNLNWTNLINADFAKAKLTAAQIAGVYAQASSAISGYFGAMAQGFDQNSKEFKILFAMQKSFAVASSLISIWQGVANAMAAPYPMNLVAWAGVLAQGMNILAQLKNVNYTGAHDKGGYIPSGAIGLVGEIGPELVRGPATVTSRRETANMMNDNQNNGTVIVNLIEDKSRAGTTTDESTDEERIINIFVANIRQGGEIADSVESTYGLQRQGY